MTIVDYTLQGTIGTSQLPKRYDVAMYQGDTFEVVLRFKDSNGAAIDLTGVTFVCKFAGVPPANPPAVQPSATAATPVNGEVTILILDTSTLSGTYEWDIQLVVTASGKKRTYMGGSVTVTGDITP